MKIEVTQCGMCKHYSEEQYCEIWQQYITNDAFYCACGAKADRKTENGSEKPNNYCDDCLYTDTCDSKEFFYACTSKATISKMEQVDKDINVRSKDEPTTEDCDYCKMTHKYWYEHCDTCKYKSKDKPQTSKIIEAYSRGWTDGADAVKAIQTECNPTCKFYDERCLNVECYDCCDGYSRYKLKDEPQAERSE